MALTLSDWIAHADKAGLVMKFDDLLSCELGVDERIVPLEGSMHNLQEYNSRFLIPQHNVSYDPEVFFNALSNKFRRVEKCDSPVSAGMLHQNKPIEMDENEPVFEKKTMCYGMLSGVLGLVPYVEIFYDDNGTAATGHGDSFTRYIKWSKLSGLPSLFFSLDRHSDFEQDPLRIIRSFGC